MNFREMRRKNQLLTETECAEILIRSTSGTLAVLGDNGYPYAVPLSYVYADGKLYFHCARSGHKLDAIKNCEKVSFCVIDEDRVVPQEYTTYFRSVIVFGRARIEDDETKIRSAMEELALKYSPHETKESRDNEINNELPALCLVSIEIDHMTGKEAIEFVKAKKA
ncbi:MAG: pyridoxamine 5'-phosphate oxidase family protein [Firmicutes bacterium]|nr:pyridoxamine 5'-phosphate oxidase family protein [Bacillota bacterium]